MNTNAEKRFFRLEVLKVVIAFLNPLILLFVGAFIGTKIDSYQDYSSHTLEKRYEIYSDIGTSINDLYCYFAYIGHWKQFAPDEIIIVKEQLDRKMYTYRPIMSKELFKLYREFSTAIFEKREFSEESDSFSVFSPRLRTSSKFRKEAARLKGYEWDPKWDKLFTNETKRQNEVHKRYYSLLGHLAIELKIIH